MGALITGTKWVAVETIVSRVLQIITALYIARILGPQAMGTVALVQVALEIFRIFSEMGITQALVYYKNPTRDQLSTLYTINWLLASLMYIAIIVLAPFISGFFKEKILADLLPLAGLSVLIAASGQQVFALLQKNLMFKVTAFISIVAAITNIVVSVSLVTLGWGIWSIVWGQLAGLLIRSCLALSYGIRNGLLSGFGVKFRTVRPLLKFGLYQTGAMSMNMINSRADQIIIGKTIGISALGIYSIGSQITLQAMQQINSVATRVAFPGISKSQDNLEEVKRIYLAMIANVLLVSAPLFIGLAVLSPTFVTVVLGEKWSELSPVLSILCAYVLVRSVGNMNGPLVMGLGKANWSFYWNLALLFFIPGIILLSSLSGKIEVVALAMLMAQLALTVISYFYWIKPLIGACALDYTVTLARPIFSALIMATCLLFSHEMISVSNDLLYLFLMVMIGVFFYLLASMIANRKNVNSFIKGVFST